MGIDRVENRKLERLIQLSGLSNERLAKHVNDLAEANGISTTRYNHVSVRNWLRGGTPRGHTPQFIATALGRRLGRPVSLADIGMEDVDGAITLGPSFPDDVDEAIGSALALVRADIAGGLTASTPSIAADAWSELIVKWMIAPEPSGLIDPRELNSASPADAIRYTTDAFSQMDYRFGGGHARRSLVAYFETDVEPLLRSTNLKSPIGRAVLQEASALLRLTAWTAYDAGLHGTAQRYFAHALRLAQDAGDRALGGRILAGMSHQANFLGHFSHAVNLARSAVRGANGYATPTGMALFHAMEARGLASLGDEPGCTRALQEADRWFERRSPQNDPYWLRYFDEAELAAEKAHCFRELSKPRLSAEFAHEALEHHGSIYVRSSSFVRTVLATSHIAQGDVEQGIALAEDVVTTLSTGLRSSRTVAYVQDFLSRIEHLEMEPAVSRFITMTREKLPEIGSSTR